MNGIDALTFLDIIRNEELYTSRLNELKEAEKSLGEAKFIAATVEQANKYRDEAKKMKEDAVAMKLRIEEEIKVLKDKSAQEIKEAVTELEQNKAKVKKDLEESRLLFKAAKEQEKANEAEKERIRKYDMSVCEQASKTENERRDFMTKLEQAKEILNG